MSSYLVIASYTSEGVKGVLKSGGTARADAVRSAVEGLGGKLEGFWLASGEHDFVGIVQLPSLATKTRIFSAASCLMLRSTTDSPATRMPAPADSALVARTSACRATSEFIIAALF